LPLQKKKGPLDSEREIPRREGKRLTVWLKYPNAINLFLFIEILCLCLCSEKMASSGENGFVLIDLGHACLLSSATNKSSTVIYRKHSPYPFS
jgi:hypothetical protein